MSGRFRIGCCAETDEPNWRWVSSALATTPSGDEIDWTFFSNIPQNALERAICGRAFPVIARAGGWRRPLVPLASIWSSRIIRW